MEIDKSKFRFKIGDKVKYQGEEVEILAYYFSGDFNKYGPDDVYGYTIKRVSEWHNGSGRSFDEYGNILSFPHKNCYFVSEKDVEPISSIKYDKSSEIHSPKDWADAKPGDKVRVKKRNGSSSSYQYAFNDDMANHSGEIFTIRTIEREDFPNKEFPANYCINLNEIDWLWSDAMLELITDSPTKNIIQKVSVPVKNLFKKESIEITLSVKKKKPNIEFNL